MLFDDACNLYRENKYEEAITLFTKSLEEDTYYDKSKAYYNIGVSYIKLAKYEEAVKNFKLALSINEIHHMSMFNLGKCYIMLEEYKKAYTYFKAAFSFNKYDDDYIKGVQVCEKNLNIIRR